MAVRSLSLLYIRSLDRQPVREVVFFVTRGDPANPANLPTLTLSWAVGGISSFLAWPGAARLRGCEGARTKLTRGTQGKRGKFSSRAVKRGC
jgi:hypothetical protein